MTELDGTSLTSMDKPLRLGLTLFVLVFGVFGLWSALAPLDGAAYAMGRVTVASHSKTVQHLEGGIVREILVSNGDRVAAGQPLIQMDETQSQAMLQIASVQLLSLQVKEARLLAERDTLDRIVYPESMAVHTPEVQAEQAAQEEIFDARTAAMSASIEVLEQRVEQLRSKITGLTALRESEEKMAASYDEELADVRTLLDQGFSERTRLRELERAYATHAGETSDLIAQISSTQVQIGETRLQMIQLERQFQEEVVNELAATQTAINDARERVRALKDVVARTTIRAPEAGFVNGMQFHTVGGVISPGTPILDIVPDGDDMIVEAQVSPIDIDRISLNQEATIRFSTFGNMAPTIFGRLIHLSADSFVDEMTGAPYYQARIEVTAEGMEDLGELQLLPGMPAEVFIATGERTFLQYLFKPLSNTMARSFNED